MVIERSSEDRWLIDSLSYRIKELEKNKNSMGWLRYWHHSYTSVREWVLRQDRCRVRRFSSRKSALGGSEASRERDSISTPANHPTRSRSHSTNYKPLFWKSPWASLLSLYLSCVLSLLVLPATFIQFSSSWRASRDCQIHISLDIIQRLLQEENQNILKYISTKCP